jgi:hypothetical protein
MHVCFWHPDWQVDVGGHLVQAEKKARQDRDKMNQVFMDWLSRYVKDAAYVNLGSTTQMQQLFFGHYKDKKLLDKSRVFSTEKDAAVFESETALVEDQNMYAKWTAVQMKAELKDRGLKTTGKKADLLERLLQVDADVLNMTTSPPPHQADSAIAPSVDSTTSSADDQLCSDIGDVDVSVYTALDLEALQDICTARQIRSHDLPEGSSIGDVKSSLIALIAQDIREFRLQQASKTVGWPSSTATASTNNNTSLQASSMRSIYDTGSTTTPSSSTTTTANIAEIAQLKAPKRHVEFTINSFGIKPKEFTPAGVPKVGNSVLKDLSGTGVFSGELLFNFFFFFFSSFLFFCSCCD